jgi:hypothetical protein
MLAAHLLALALWGHAVPAWADGLSPGAAAPAGLTATVAVGPLSLKESDLQASEKPDHVFLMADLFPYRDAIRAAGGKASPELLARGLVAQWLVPRYPRARRFKVTLVEFPERDEYDAPRWDKIKVLGKFEARMDGKKMKLTKLKE